MENRNNMNIKEKIVYKRLEQERKENRCHSILQCTIHNGTIIRERLLGIRAVEQMYS